MTPITCAAWLLDDAGHYVAWCRTCWMAPRQGSTWDGIFLALAALTEENLAQRHPASCTVQAG